MANTIKQLAVGTVGRKIVQRAGWSWLGYGVAAYAGLRLLRHFGILEKQADRGVKIMEKGARAAMG